MNNDKVIGVLEKAAVRIGCPPGDNADADLCRELLAAIAALRSPAVGVEEIESATDAFNDRTVDLWDNKDDHACYVMGYRRGLEEYPKVFAPLRSEDAADQAPGNASAHSPWISVKDRLPEANVYSVLVTNGKQVEIYTGSNFDTDRLSLAGVTHWMPLPVKPPTP